MGFNIFGSELNAQYFMFLDRTKKVLQNMLRQNHKIEKDFQFILLLNWMCNTQALKLTDFQCE